MPEQPAKPGIPKLKKPVAGQTKRSAFGDLTNATKEAETKKATGILKPAQKPTVGAGGPTKVTRNASKKTADARKPRGVKASQESDNSLVSSQESLKSHKQQALTNLVHGVPEERQEEDFSFIITEDFEESDKSGLLSIDRENYSDVFNIGIYAQDIFDYYKRREKMFVIPGYLGKGSRITQVMRAILVDWMVEIQENFELNHETLYLAVKLCDMFLSRAPQDKEKIQLVGAAAFFIASKFDERCPPLIEDFTYICDNSFDRDEFIQMEMEILRKVDFDLGIPISYRFLRRYSKVAGCSIVTLTLARFILEMSLMEYGLVAHRDSLIAAAALYIAMAMNGDKDWSGEVVQTSGYTVQEFRPLVKSLHVMLTQPPNPQLTTVRVKYSHIIFHEVAKIPTLSLEALGVLDLSDD